MESIFGWQVDSFDHSRERLLFGRRELMELLPTRAGDVWVDMGGGTGWNVEQLGPRLQSLASVHIVDAARSMLKVADARIAQHGWKNVWTACADAATFRPPGGVADIVTFSYSLTMMPEWRAALAHAYELLKPGGHIGVVDFYVSPTRHSLLACRFWSAWFKRGHVTLSAENLSQLVKQFELVSLQERLGRLPFMVWPRVPYYMYIGRKPVH